MTPPAGDLPEPVGEPGSEPDADVARFAELVRREPVPLGEAALTVASVLGHPAPVVEGMARLGALATGVPGDDLGAVTRHLFSTVGLRGDETTYYDPANSLLPAVLDRRRGIPVTLAIIAVDVARRLGIEAHVVAMPGHVLIGDGDPPRQWCDGFQRGQWLDPLGARARFAAIHGRHAPFDPRFLAATPDAHVLARLLGNLVGIYGSRGQASELVRVLRLRAAVPGFEARDRPALAAALGSVGRYQEAATVWQAEADATEGEPSDEAEAAAAVLRARLN